MEMIDGFKMALALLAGVLLGFFYFGGLWMTVQRLPSIRHPALLTLGSFLGRTAIAMLVFYSVMGGSLVNLLVCLVGFLLARQASFKLKRLLPDP
jgi:F1F0 ATPase subunit 2